LQRKWSFDVESPRPSTSADSSLIAGTKNGTAIAISTPEAVYVRDVNLVDDLMGHIDFTEMMLFQMTGKRPTSSEVAVVNAILVGLMEHGLTPSSITARLIFSSSPDAMQGAVAAGLLGAGGTFLGAMEDLARLLQEGVRLERAGMVDSAAYCRSLISQRLTAGTMVPGFGHHIHRPDDPRTARLLSIADEHGVSGPHIHLVRVLSGAMDEIKGRHVTLNVTGAVAAVLSDLGYPWQIMRGFSLIARTAGLVGHVLEEQRSPLGREIWDLVERAVPYTGSRGDIDNSSQSHAQ
jgi:citrate synthase